MAEVGPRLFAGDDLLGALDLSPLSSSRARDLLKLLCFGFDIDWFALGLEDLPSASLPGSPSSPAGLRSEMLRPFKLDKDLGAGAALVTGDCGVGAGSPKTLENEMPELFNNFEESAIGGPLLIESLPAATDALVIEMLEFLGRLT